MTPVGNPTSSDVVVAAANDAIRELAEGDTFLLWFIGHALPGGNRTQLHLLHQASTGDIGLEYSRLNAVLQQHLAVNKVVVLDCCYAEMALDSCAPTIPDNTLVWPTAGRNESANPSK